MASVIYPAGLRALLAGQSEASVSRSLVQATTFIFCHRGGPVRYIYPRNRNEDAAISSRVTLRDYRFALPDPDSLLPEEQLNALLYLLRGERIVREDLIDCGFSVRWMQQIDAAWRPRGTQEFWSETLGTPWSPPNVPVRVVHFSTPGANDSAFFNAYMAAKNDPSVEKVYVVPAPPKPFEFAPAPGSRRFSL